MKAPQGSQELFERALSLHQGGRKQEAESLYRKVISRNAQHDRALFGLSVIRLEAGDVDAATRYLERAVEIRPGDPKYLTNLGEVYRRRGQLRLAARVFERVLADHPELVEARQNLAVTLIVAGAPAEALPHVEQLALLRPGDAMAHLSLAFVLLRLERPDASAAHARRAVELAPTLASAHRQLGSALDSLADKAGAIASYRRAVELSPTDHKAHSDLILAMLTDPNASPRSIFDETRAWAKLHAEPLRQHQRAHSNDASPERKLRVGYVSPDFRAHAAQQFMVPLLQNHDPSTCEIFLYASVAEPDAETDWYRTFAGDHYRDIFRLSDLDAAELVRHDGIDILVDLALHGTNGRLQLFALKPAPVQMTWLGYAGTTGLDTVDYRITDPYFNPPDADVSVYSEECLYLPASFWCYDALQADLPVAPLPALTAGFVTFGCLNSPRKLHAGVLALWARVLREAPASRLLLHLEAHARAAASRMLAAEGVSADRVEFVDRVSRRENLERHQRIDIALDTFPFAGGTTTLDATWMGVPVVTLSGAPTLQRAGVCIAMNLALPELVAQSEDEFVTQAVTLSRDLERLGRLRAELRPRLEASSLGDAPRFARNLESVYRTAWQRHCSRGR